MAATTVQQPDPKPAPGPEQGAIATIRPVVVAQPLAAPRRLTDRDILEIVDAAYEYAAWAADMGMVDFDAFADLGDVLREMRARIAQDGAS